MNCRVENDPSSPDAILVLFGGHRKRFIPATPEREAAGELLEAAKTFLETWERPDFIYRILDQKARNLRKAIARAEGRKP